MHLWASLAAASSFGKSLEQNFAAFNIPTRNFTPPQYLGYPGCPGNEGVPTKSMRISSGKEFTIGDLSVHGKYVRYLRPHVYDKRTLWARSY